MIRLTILTLFTLFQLNCAVIPLAQNTANESVKKSDTETVEQQSSEISRMVDDIKGVLKKDWSVSQSGNKIFVVRQKPITVYSSISLPLNLKLDDERMEHWKDIEDYKITLEFKDYISDEKYFELAEINRKTEIDFRILEEPMGEFPGKGNYRPKTAKDEILFTKYQDALKNLPYAKLPDLYTEQHSIYIETSRHTSSAFYYPHEESECRAVLENIYSFANPYPKNGRFAGKPYEAEGVVYKTFASSRDYDMYLRDKELNLPKNK